MQSAQAVVLINPFWALGYQFFGHITCATTVVAIAIAIAYFQSANQNNADISNFGVTTYSYSATGVHALSFFTGGGGTSTGGTSLKWGEVSDFCPPAVREGSVLGAEAVAAVGMLVRGGLAGAGGFGRTPASEGLVVVDVVVFIVVVIVTLIVVDVAVVVDVDVDVDVDVAVAVVVVLSLSLSVAPQRVSRGFQLLAAGFAATVVLAATSPPFGARAPALAVAAQIDG
ncbi:hypothetical protein HDU90_006336 [Geranomyces variabilis]|nr:hypothetical protein HDU90_006336 [Geranomyces variabilis]